jgi:hypothetical protein
LCHEFVCSSLQCLPSRWTGGGLTDEGVCDSPLQLPLRFLLRICTATLHALPLTFIR